LTQKGNSTTHVTSGNSNTTNTNTPNNNPPSGQHVSDNPFGTGGSGGGSGRGNGTGFGDDNGSGTGPGNGNGSGGEVRRYLVEQPNTTNIQSDENCTIVLSVLVDADGNIIGQPVFAKGASSTNNIALINQVINVVKREARFNKAPGAKNIKQAITIRIVAK
jgi:outer membrane biosynthesis protein TonB